MLYAGRAKAMLEYAEQRKRQTEKGKIMKKLILCLAIVLCASGLVSPTANALSISIALGDQPYYVHGPGYWAGRVYYVWVPGHWRWHRGHRVWIHGHYRVR